MSETFRDRAQQRSAGGEGEQAQAPPATGDGGAAHDGQPLDVEEPQGARDDLLDDEQDEHDERDGTDDAVAEAEAVIADDLAALAAERDEYRLLAQRIQADFENYKKRIDRQRVEQMERAAEGLVTKLLPVLDTADLALAHDPSGALEQVVSALHDVLAREGLERIDPLGEEFDPNEHDAVLHEEGDGGPDVVEVMRAGYRWKGRVLRAAMVKVRG